MSGESRVYQSYIEYARKRRRVGRCCVVEEKTVEEEEEEEEEEDKPVGEGNGVVDVSTPTVSEAAVSYTDNECEPYNQVWVMWERGLPLPPRTPSPVYDP